MEQGDQPTGHARNATASLKRRPFSAMAVVGASVVLILLAHTLATGDFAPLRLGGVRHVVNNGALAAPQQQQPQYARIPTPVPGELNPMQANFMAIAGTSPSDVWVSGAASGSGGGGEPFLLHFDGNQWSRTTSPLSQPMTDISMDAPDDGWAIAGTTLLHYTGGAWQVFADQPPGVAPGSYLSSISMSGPDDGWIVGSQPSNGADSVGSVLLHYTGGQWAPFTGPSLGAGISLISVAASSPDEAWAVGTKFSTDGVTGVIAHYQNGAWSLMGDGFPNANLLRIAVAGPGDAWAVGVGGPTSGILVHCLDGSCQQVPNPSPNILSVISMRSSSDGWIGGDGAVIFRRDGSQWTQRDPTYHQVSLTGLLVFSDLDGWAIGQSNGVSLPPGAVMLRCVNGAWQVYQLHVRWES